MSLLHLLLSSGAPRASNGALLGDSTVADDYPPASGIIAVSDYMLALLPGGSTINDLSVPGESIQDQLDHWNALSGPTKAAFDWVGCQPGLNDTDPSEAVSITMSRYQGMVDAIRAANATCRIVLATMTPAAGRWAAIYPGSEAEAQQKWEDMNDAIMGIGPSAITGANHSFNGHSTAMADESGNLDAAYDTGDGIHPNNAGRQINAQYWRSGLRSVGY